MCSTRFPVCRRAASSAPVPRWTRPACRRSWPAGSGSASPERPRACVYGEHGDSSFVPWSLATIANNSHRRLQGSAPRTKPENIKWDGRTTRNWRSLSAPPAPRSSRPRAPRSTPWPFPSATSARALPPASGTALTVSTLMHGEYGVDDVCLSTLALVDRQRRVRGKILSKLTPDEQAKLQQQRQQAEGGHRTTSRSECCGPGAGD